jgi:hypothetical protein
LKKILLAFVCCVSSSAFAQTILDTKLDGSENGKSLESVLQEFENKNPVRFYFLSDWISTIAFAEGFEGKTLRTGLTDLFLGTDLNFIELDSHTIVIVKDPTMVLQYNNTLNVATKEQKKIEKVTLGTPGGSTRKTVTLSGKVLDSKTDGPMIGVGVLVNDLKINTSTNAAGEFQVTVPAGSHVISFNFINYEEKILDLEIYTNGSHTLKLEETPMVLEEIVVRDRAMRDIQASNIGVTQLSIKEIKRAPALLGEVDLIKQIQTLPGVTTTGEAASGFNVRGGSVDQNLIMYDGLPVFNSSHVFGFFSTFNAEAVRDVTFHSGGIPAEYGGRISSVLNIRSREGSYEKWETSGGIGIISTNLAVGGPIKKDKSSIIVSARSTYSDWLINTVKSNYVDLQNATVTFYDGSAKLTHLFSKQTKLTLSGYISHDQFRLRGDSVYRWDTKLSTLQFDHEFGSSGVSAGVMAGYGSYQYNVLDENPNTGFDLHYRLQYPTAKAHVAFNRGGHKAEAGLQSTYYNFEPGTINPTNPSSDIKFVQIQTQRSIESAAYISDQFDLTRKLNMTLGLRYSFFDAIGLADVNLYKPDAPLATFNQVGTLHVEKGDKIKSFNNPEPRIAFKYAFNDEQSVKLGYNRMFQYLHLVTNTTAITPVDIWQPSGYYFRPQVGDQVSAGYFHTFAKQGYESFVEAYYKTMNNVLDFKDGAILLLNPALETDLLQGKGRAYGVEFSVKKSTGRLIGSFSYAYSRSFRTIIGTFPEENINDGREYRSNFDQPHVINLSWRYNITRRYFFTGAFTYHTGRPITLPLTAYSIQNFTVSSFSDRNQFRIPDYHRLDIGLVVEGNHKRRKILDGTWTFSVYNVYARKNPYSIFFKEARPGILRPYRLAVIGTALPSISYSFKIG